MSDSYVGVARALGFGELVPARISARSATTISDADARENAVAQEQLDLERRKLQLQRQLLVMVAASHPMVFVY